MILRVEILVLFLKKKKFLEIYLFILNNMWQIQNGIVNYVWPQKKEDHLKFFIMTASAESSTSYLYTVNLGAAFPIWYVNYLDFT